MKPGALFCLCLLLFVSGRAAAQRETGPYWFALERGKLYFRQGAYGEALIAFEDARTRRRDLFLGMRRDMIALLSVPEVRSLGDSLELVEKYIAEKHQISAAAALEELYYRVPRESLGGSVLGIPDEFERLKDYPEAEYWIGETYRVEGELGIALKQYRRAYELRGLLETPGFVVPLLYRIADVHRLRQEYNEMESRLLEILEGDSLWSGGSGSFARTAMTRTLENDGINRFLTLYRYSKPEVLAAHRLLGFYYYASGRHGRAVEHLIFAFLIQNTILIEEIARNQFDYSFSTLDDLIARAGERPVLSSYPEDVEYYKTMYYLGTALYGDGKLVPARNFWTFLSRHGEAGEWRGRAAAQLARPALEGVLEMP
jgi:tetratricopeptide (TPR) repeat protein